MKNKPRRTAFIVAAASIAIFISVMAWDVIIQHPRITGDRICIENMGAATVMGADGSGAYSFDRNTGRLVLVPATMALGNFFSGNFICGVRTLTRTIDGLIAVRSVFVSIVAMLIAVYARTSNRMPKTDS